MAWVPPIGLPSPTFGIDEVAPAFPSPWTAAVTDCYYVEPTHPSATNTSNPNGWPAQPRLTIPTPITPVSGPVVVQVVGSYATSHISPELVMNGTVTWPIFIRGTSDAVRATFTSRVFVHGSYFVVEYMNWVGEKAGPGLVTSFAAWRHLIMQGNGTTLGGTGAAGLASTYSANNIVFWDLEVFDSGDWQASFDQDSHGFGIGRWASDIWIVDCTIYHCSGNGLQITTGPTEQAGTPLRIWVGRNHVYETKQDCLWTKQAIDVIFSQNLCHDPRRDTAQGSGIGGQYGQDNVWVIYNRIYNGERGVAFETTGGIEGPGYIIGNVITSIHDSNVQDQGKVVSLRSSLPSWRVVNNTFHDYDEGVWALVGVPTVDIVNNTFSGRDIGLALYDIHRESDDGTSTMKNNNFESPLRVRVVTSDAGTYTTVAAIEAALGARASGNLSVDPLFVSSAGDDYHLQGSSQLVDAGIADDAAYAEFEARYPGRSIRVDYDAVPRPFGAGWDIGAYEGSGTHGNRVKGWRR